MMYSVLSITIRATPLSAVTRMWSLSLLRFSSAECSDLVMFVCIGVGVKNSIESMVEPLQSTPFSSPAWRAATVVVDMYSLMRMVSRVTANFGLFVVKTFLQVLVPSLRG